LIDNLSPPTPPSLTPEGTPLIKTLVGVCPLLLAQVTTQSLTLPDIVKELSILYSLL
jgi:hypothetical protein